MLPEMMSSAICKIILWTESGPWLRYDKLKKTMKSFGFEQQVFFELVLQIRMEHFHPVILIFVDDLVIMGSEGDVVN